MVQEWLVSIGTQSASVLAGGLVSGVQSRSSSIDHHDDGQLLSIQYELWKLYAFIAAILVVRMRCGIGLARGYCCPLRLRLADVSHAVVVER
jgi:hypothetical protein